MYPMTLGTGTPSLSAVVVSMSCTASNLLMSYYNPDDHHLKVTAIPW